MVLRPTQVLVSPGLDKIADKSHACEDVVTEPPGDTPQTNADSSAIAGASDTESNSEREHEVRQRPRDPGAEGSCSQLSHTEDESARNRLSSVSSSAWSANPDWVRRRSLPLCKSFRFHGDH